ncbi:MAG: DUF502 domain-containing protein [Gammaproteobacteria bacterium]|nr:DUF502 domain-containing protein [Gammaproteobacteria bacterium]
MLKTISRILLTGFITLVPVMLTAYLMYWLAVSSEQLMGKMLHWVLPETYYFPGLGMIVGLLVMFIVGLLMKAYLIRRIFSLGETLLYRLPLIKSIYRAFRDLFDFMSPHKEGMGQVVAVNLNGIQAIGFITQEDKTRLPECFHQDNDCVLVYLPMSYMMGGHTIFVPREQVKPIDMSMDEAMRFVLTAGITGKSSR